MLKKTLLSILPLLLLGFPVMNFLYAGNEGNKKLKWHTFSEALAKGKSENKLIVVDFYTDWCTWCKVMDEKTYGDPAVVDFASKKLVLAKVNAESNEKTTYKGKEYTFRQLSAAFGIRGFPTTIFLTPKGEFLTDVTGYITAEKFLPMLQYLEGGHYEKLTFDEFLAKREKK